MDRVAQPKLVPSEAGVRAVLAALPKTHLRAALIGTGIRESRTPWMHMAEGARLGLEYSYSLIDFDRVGLTPAALGSVLKLAVAHGLAGLNVTHPFKQTIIPYLDALSAEAAAIGAVNTIVFSGGSAIGHNTDCFGFTESFRREMKGAKLRRVVLIGAGGAGKAVAHALRDLGAEQIDIFDLDRSLSADLAGSLNSIPRSGRANAIRDLSKAALGASGIVNTTPVGMAKYPGMPVPAGALRPDLWVADIIYFPAETELLRTAAARGCRVLPGRGMAVFQAVKAFELITGRLSDPREMSRHFDSASGTTNEPAPD